MCKYMNNAFIMTSPLNVNYVFNIRRSKPYSCYMRNFIPFYTIIFLKRGDISSRYKNFFEFFKSLFIARSHKTSRIRNLL